MIRKMQAMGAKSLLTPETPSSKMDSPISGAWLVPRSKMRPTMVGQKSRCLSYQRMLGGPNDRGQQQIVQSDHGQNRQTKEPFKQPGLLAGMVLSVKEIHASGVAQTGESTKLLLLSKGAHLIRFPIFPPTTTGCGG